MSYARRRPSRPSRRRRSRNPTKQHAATSLQVAWRYHSRKKKGGLVTRTALSNRKAIKKLKQSVETLYATEATCTRDNMFAGQHLITDVDAVGYCNANMSTPVWTGGSMTTGPVQAPFSWTPLIMKPLYIPTATATSGANGYREGAEVQLKWISIKGNVSAYPAIYNGKGLTTGYNYNARPMRQRVRIYVLHDSQPAGDRLQTSYHTELVSNQLYLMNNTPGCWGPNPFIPGTPGNNTNRPNQYIRNGPGAGSGGAIHADGSHWPESTAYFERDYVNNSGKHTQNKDKRFKVLKMIDVGPLRQEECQGGDGGGQVPSSQNFAVTLKLPYKLLFKNVNSVLPCNQQIIIMACSNVLAGGTSAGDVNDLEIPPYRCPRIEIQCKVAYTDA